jgi:hypothetical protein
MAMEESCAMGEIFSTGIGSNLPGVDSNLPERGLTKRTYKPPRLFSYGTLRDVTLALERRTGQDGAHSEDHKTRP